MSPELFGALLGALLGAGGIGAVVKAWFDRSRTDADALAAWSSVWTGNLDAMKKDLAELRAQIPELRARIVALEEELAREQLRNHLLTALLIEHGGTPPG